VIIKIELDMEASTWALEQHKIKQFVYDLHEKHNKQIAYSIREDVPIPVRVTIPVKVTK